MYISSVPRGHVFIFCWKYQTHFGHVPSADCVTEQSRKCCIRIYLGAQVYESWRDVKTRVQLRVGGGEELNLLIGGDIAVA